MTQYDSGLGTRSINGYHFWLLVLCFLPFFVIGLWTLAGQKNWGRFYKNKGQFWGIFLEAFMSGLFVTLVDDTTYGLFKYILGVWSLVDVVEWYKIQFCLTCDWFWWWADFYFFRIAVTPRLMALTIIGRAIILVFYVANRVISMRKLYKPGLAFIH
jgi:hypothetical protein